MRRRVLLLVTVPVLLLSFAGPANATDNGLPPLAHRPL